VTLILLVPAILVTMEILSPAKTRWVEEPSTGSRGVAEQYFHVSELEVL
jgi:hypothetical protein